MKIQNLMKNQEKKLGDMEISGEIVAPNGVRREKWEGYLNCRDSQLTSLEGAPRYIGNDFMCNLNLLTTLVGGPDHVSGCFWCPDNQLTSLAGAPQYVGRNFKCSGNRLSSLEGAPQYVGGNFWFHDNQLTSLEGIHEQILQIHGFANFEKNPIKSHVLGLLLIKGLKSVIFDNKQLSDIINKYLPLGDIMECQNELIDAGLEDFAQI